MKTPLSFLFSQFAILLLAIQALSAGNNALPVQGTPVFVSGSLSDFRLGGDAPQARYSTTPVEGQAFDRAIHVQVMGRTANAWDVQILTPPATVPLKKGDQLLAIVNVRCTAAADGVGRISAYIQNSEPPWTGLGGTDAAVGKEWKRLYIDGKAGQDFAAGTYELTLHLGRQAQTLEFGGITMLDLGQNVDESKLPYTPISYPGEEPEALWRAAAAERIDKYRKGDLTVRVEGACADAAARLRVRHVP
jgi:hypothetical protein